MSGTINLHVGSIEDMGKRFICAWQRLENGAVVDETHLTFLDLETMVSTLSPERLTLLRHVRQHPAENIAGTCQEPCPGLQARA
jgi:predicted transcriptional regulator